jgi:ParB family transcriptional regulator, chromosome partitioning protein
MISVDFGIVEEINISDIELSPYNFRSSTGIEIGGIANSIIRHGLLQPIIVRAAKDLFEIIAGSRRYLACKSLGRKKITCHVVELDDKQMFEVSLIENIQRKSLTPLEEATAFKIYVSDNGWGSIADLSSKLGKSASYITKRISLLNLPDDVMGSIRNSSLKPSVAEELLSVRDASKQSQLGSLIVKRHLSINKVRDLLKNDSLYDGSSDRSNLRRELRGFTNSIIALKIAMNRLGAIIEDEENWLVYEFLMQQKRMLNNQIDIMMNAKKKYARQIFRYRNFYKSKSNLEKC